jgi:hypothetical protein
VAAAAVKRKKAGGPAKKSSPPKSALAQNTSPASETQHFDTGIGAGFFNVFLPQPTLELLYRHEDTFSIGVDLGYVSLPSIDRLDASTSTYYGIDLKYFPMKSSFFVSLAAGMRSVEIATTADVTVNSDVTPVKWTRNVSQTLLVPRIGWTAVSQSGSGASLALGYLMPSTSSFTTKADPEGVPGVSSEDFEELRKEKADAVKKYTHVSMPHLEFKYFWYFDFI